MPTYNPPVRDMQFVLHEVLNVTEELKALPVFFSSRRRHTS